MNSNPVIPTPPSTMTRTLRWWPAALLVVLMLLLRLSSAFAESPSRVVIIASFFGPALASVMVLVWWLSCSRATRRERVLGTVGTIGLIVASAFLLHPTLSGMRVMMFVVPYAVAAFAITLCLLAPRPALRLPVALTAVALTVGYWNLLQSAGSTGNFQPQLSWRWESTAEQRFLQTMEAAPAVLEESLAGVDITLAGSDWPGFRGRLRDGRQPGIVLNADWGQAPPKSIWKKAIGPGWSSFSVAGNRLFTQEQRGDDEAVVCLDAATGDVLWVFAYPSRFWEATAGAGPRGTPTIADEGLFALGANGMLVALNPLTGAKRWTRDLQLDADRQPPMWGFASSPLVTQGLVVVHAGGASDKGVLAYRTADGELAWSAPSGDHSYSSPQLASFDGETGLLMSTNAGLQFLDGTDGHILWEDPWPGDNYRALQPLVTGNSVLITTSLGIGTRKITVRKLDSKWEITEDWSSRDLKADFNDFVEYQGYLYGFDGNIFTCVSLDTGKRVWKRGRYGSGQVLLLPDAGQLLVTSETGEIVLLKADPKKLVELGRVQAIEGKTWNHPVLTGSRLFIRNAAMAACYELALDSADQPEKPTGVATTNK